MNERIKELAMLSGWSSFEALDERHQVFAQLIIQECIEQCWKVGELEGTGYTAPDLIRKHFEV